MDVDEDSLEMQLIRFCEDGDLDAVDALLQEGVEVNCPCGVDDMTPLLVACLAGHGMVMHRLICASADPEVVDRDGRGLALLAAECGSVELLSWLLNEELVTLAECSNDGSTPLLCAAAGGNPDMVAWLLDGPPGAQAEMSIESQDSRGADAMLIAAENGNLEALQELLQRGATCESLDSNGSSAMHYSAAGGHIDTLDFLSSLGLSCSERDMDGDTPLLIAAHEGHVEVVEWLLSNGADLSERNNDGVSAPMAAMAGNRSEVIEVLSRHAGDDWALWSVDFSRHPNLMLNFLESGGQKKK